MKLSIVTPSYNSAEYLTEAIESVAGQQYPDYEHVIVDGDSNDGTKDVLQSYGHLDHLRWRSEPDEGQSDALNEGFRLADGDIIGWLNADDRYLPGCFETVARTFGQFPEIDVVYGNYRWIDADGTVMQLRRELDFDLFMLKYVDTLWIPSETLFFRRDVLEEEGTLDSDFSYAMDYEFILRLALGGYRFRHVQEFLADFRWHEASKSSSYAGAMNRDRIRALLTHDPVLRAVPVGLRTLVRKGLEWAARSKRYALKAWNGYYFTQWFPEGDDVPDLVSAHRSD
jgi:glycosyltransferase involved in cell wall biosynthesis